MMIMLVIGTLGVSRALATTIVSIVLHGSAMITIILAITSLLSGGVDTILTLGWTGFIDSVKEVAVEKGLPGAIAW
ncbi:MAG: circular bacteriocin, circularin A/uberolysin family [Sulfobacillus thermosulfidooxidans]|uniref:Circular bacteriocin, circularin A/uberolysin family n=1 Tax=Sulfobacillus thermosulfidooxidans TaxID=28034 RepID=A0A2T2WRB3_SULTH|nr:MAG: circular bacteriocin, circularin A/uberolysin family [Sulfobacillus thermosulfidooxidans]